MLKSNIWHLIVLRMHACIISLTAVAKMCSISCFLFKISNFTFTLYFNDSFIGGVIFHSLLVTRCKSPRYSLQNSLVTRCRSRSLQKGTRYSLQKLLVVKNHSLLVAKFARYPLQIFTRYSLRNFLVTRYKLARCKKSLAPRCEIQLLIVAKNNSLLVAEISRRKKSFVTR